MDEKFHVDFYLTFLLTLVIYTHKKEPRIKKHIHNSEFSFKSLNLPLFIYRFVIHMILQVQHEEEAYETRFNIDNEMW